MFQCGPLYHANYNATEDIIINQGGTDSGKTYAIIQVLFTYATVMPAPKDDPIITIIGSSVPNLKKGAYRVAKSIYSGSEDLQQRVKSWNETDRTIYFKSGWIMEFTSYSTEQEAKQGKRQFSFFNEANSIEWLVFWQVAKRTRQKVFIDYNPSAPFFYHEKLIGTTPETNDLGATVKLIISDHRHNPFLSEKEHLRTEGIKDKNLWLVYARGKTGNLIGLIFPNAIKIPDEQYPWQETFFGGCDFGYTNDPTAGIKIVKIGESIYLHEMCYTPGIAPVQMKQIFESNGFKPGIPIYCEQDPDQINQLRAKGLTALPAIKGPGSINAGILKMKEYKIFYTASSVNLDEEFKKYMWAMDPLTGKPTNTPIDRFNHGIDASRYGIHTHFFRNRE